jgi:primosomal protein N' (replication factor Y)
MAQTSRSTTERARILRRDATKAERMLWRLLRDRALDGWRFRRQHPIKPYFADFASLEAGLIVEADGGHHAESAHDEVRRRFLEAKGWRILRFWNNDITDSPEGVLAAISAALGPHHRTASRFDPPPRSAQGREDDAS